VSHNLPVPATKSTVAPRFLWLFVDLLPQKHTGKKRL
jgi:hypothetical protein